MDGQKTLEGGAQAFHGRPDVDMGGLDGVRGNPDNKLTSWIGRFAGSQGRRGSLGFNCEVQLSGAPLSRYLRARKHFNLHSKGYVTYCIHISSPIRMFS